MRLCLCWEKPPKGISWRSVGRILGVILSILMLCTLLYGVWPYLTLWRLERAAHQDDWETLAELVDLGRVRAEIQARLNKDQASVIGAVSDGFIAWIETGIHKYGREAIPSLVTLSWVRDQFARIPDHALGLWVAISGVFFAAPDDLRLQIERAPAAGPLFIRLERQGLSWRTTMIYD
ncbi:DUF2939 domain-containing protein [Caldichromatium japonicum]|uniref:DUF2939 domain-containing protein n=1 Tax=Caldichromatium japonicum TaxID=2699430 RepID=A0A6G7VFB7_9GAMM|nr:DUF2939 domain-containing protein [Caldichromatium japonicum]QIK38590.1 DUF2939 domain-containing protein [Caldichromatium japonicum]